MSVEHEKEEEAKAVANGAAAYPHELRTTEIEQELWEDGEIAVQTEGTGLVLGVISKLKGARRHSKNRHISSNKGNAGKQGEQRRTRLQRRMRLRSNQRLTAAGSSSSVRYTATRAMSTAAASWSKEAFKGPKLLSGAHGPATVVTRIRKRPLLCWYLARDTHHTTPHTLQARQITQ